MKRANGTGGVTKLSGKRRKPWRARITIEIPELCRKIKKDIGCYETKKEALEALNKYLANPAIYDENNNVTFAQMYELWKKHEFPTMSIARKRVYNRMFEKCGILHERIFKNIKHTDFTEILDNETHSVNIEIKNLFSKMSYYAMVNDMIQKDYSKFLENRQKKSNTVERKVYTKEEILLLWKNIYKHREIDTVLVMIYTGLRIGEIIGLKKENVNLEEKIIFGAGIKTQAGKERVIPIHSEIFEILKNRYENAGDTEILFEMSGQDYAAKHQYFKRALDSMVKLGLGRHTAHDCRHTFATLLNDVNANSTAIKNVMGHTNFELTEKVYTHKDVESLRSEIEKIKLS